MRDPVLLHKVFLSLLRVHVHGTDLIDLKALAVFADALLTEEDGARRGVPDHGADDEDEKDGNKAADEAADDVHDALDEVLQRSCVVDGGGEDGGPADLLGKTLDTATAHVGDMIVGGDTHHVAGVHQLQDRLVGDGGVEIDRVNPLAHDVVRSMVQIRNNGISVYFCLFCGFGQDNTRDLVVRQVIMAETLEDVFGSLGRGNHQHGVFLFFPTAVLFQKKLPEQASDITENDVQDEGQEEDDARISIAGMCREDIDDGDGENIGTILYRLGKLDIVAAVDHIVQGVVQDQDQRVDEDQEDAQAAVQRAGIGPVLVPQPDREDKGQLQTDLID